VPASITASSGNAAGPRRIVVLGSTGSIGTQTLDVVRRLGPERARIVGLAARRNVPLLAEQIRATGAAYVAVTDEAEGPALEAAMKSARESATTEEGATAGRFVGWGDGTLVDLASIDDADTVVVAVAGAAGLAATMAACRAGKRVCIATKEVLVAAGTLVMRTAREFGAEILPIDSEHSAIFQCVQGYVVPGDIERLWITASGGPFRTWTAEQIAAARPEDALKHPTWSMGGKITIDSATLMNKGLEIIEACHLFGLPLDAVDVVVHPQSVVHSFAEMRDGALLAQFGLPDMRLPIQIALLHPEKVDSGLPRLRPYEMAALTFEKPDGDRFPAIRLARTAARMGGTAPAVLNAANEVAVGAFLDNRVAFGDIVKLVEAALRAHPSSPADSLEAVLEADRTVREWTVAAIERGGGVPAAKG
jgi:1-deoxy-D-xylulose-5-phosphate reductoisomerase